jgi:hypothetical protein
LEWYNYSGGKLTFHNNRDIEKTGTDGWDSGVVTAHYRRGSGGWEASFVTVLNTKEGGMGVSSTATAGTGDIFQVDFAWYTGAAGALYAGQVGSWGWIGTYGAYDELSISYDGRNVTWRQNGVVRLRVAAAITGNYYRADLAFYRNGARIQAAYFGPNTSDLYDPESWTTPTLSGVTNYNSASHRKKADGTVECRGEIQASSNLAANSTMFTFPSGSRPLVRCYLDFIDYTGLDAVKVLVDTDGTVKNINALTSANVYSLASIQFPTK